MLDVSYEKKLEKLGAFEISSNMLKLAKNNEKHNICLNAGRGNPNWINTQSRLAFARLLNWGVEESRRTLNDGNMAGTIEGEGIYDRLLQYLDGSSEVDEFLKKAVSYAINDLKLDAEAFLKEIADGIIGNNYPVPSRCLVNSEVVIRAYLESTLFGGEKVDGKTLVFPTEGGTAAMCYIFDALAHNGLLKPGDTIAINTPIFTPYLQIPHLTGYKLAEVELKSTEDRKWHIDPSEMDKLLDPEVKAFFLVNPSNPGAHSLREEMLEKLKEVVAKRPDLMIITDDVYGTFVDDFKTVYSVAPHNTLLVYSYSKLYGVTGWRTGLIALNEDNVFDRLIKKLPEDKLKELDFDYSIVTLDTRAFPFIERICADSRNIGLYHTSGLSTPQQIFMVLMSLTHLVCQNEDPYIDAAKNICRRRYHDLFSTLGVPEDNDGSNSRYYSLIDIYRIAARLYDEEFASWMQKNFEEVDFLMRLAEEDGVVLMEGVGFAATPGTLRVSEANLSDDAYKTIAKRVLTLLGEYHAQYEKEAK